MGASGQRLGLRLFLEGIEVPVVAASVQIGINSPATASIQVVPGDKLLEFKPRTMVHLFFWDFTRDFAPIVDPKNPQSVAEYLEVTVDEARRIIAEEPETLTEDFDELRGYKLFYSGEVIGISMVKTPAGRQAVLQCSDFSTYWDTTYQFFVSYGPNGNFMGTSAAVWAGGASMFDDLTSGHVSVMNEYLNSKPKTPGLQNVKGLMGGIISLLEAMGGVPNHTHGVNDFFTIGELKNHILQQITCEQNDDTSSRLFSNKAFHDWLSRGMSSLGTLSTFRDMLKLLFQYIYYEVVPNPAPMYVPSVKSKTRTKLVTSTSIIALPVTLRSGITDVLLQAERFSVQGWEDEPYDEDTYAKSYKAIMQKVLASKELPKPLKTKLEQTIPCFDQIKSTDREFRSVSHRDPTAYKFPPSKAFKDNRKAWRKITDICYDVLGTQPQKVTKTSKLKLKTNPEIDRLQTQIFRPDCFFVAPPKCNVLFPEQYTQFQFSRNFLQEVTRLRLHIGWEFGLNEGLLETEYYFAPATKDIKNLAKQQGNSSIRALLPWEMYSGILPKFETMHEVNYVAGRNERKRGINNSNVKGDARNYGQRVANFNYMKYRFAARSAEVSAKFNPFMVCGFPAAVIERPFVIDPSSPDDQARLAAALERANVTREQKIAVDDTSDYVREIAREYGAPTQYIGMVAGLSHNVDQGGGGTSFTMTHARSHRITEDDFLNIFSKELTRQVETEIVSTTLDADDLIAKGDWKNLKILIDATDQKMGDRLEELVERRAQQTEEAGTGINEDDVEIEERPDGAPNINSVPGISTFGSLLTQPPPQRDFTQEPTEGLPEKEYPLIGEVRQARHSTERKVIIEPVHPGELQAGKKKGPKGGKVLQVQVHSDAALMLTGTDLNASAKVFDKKLHIMWPPIVTRFGTLPIFSVTHHRRKKVVRDDKRFFLWKRVTIYEEKPTGKRLSKTIPVEEAMRPAWFSPLYSNWFIGDEIYKPFFGCGSIVDQSLFQAVDANNRVSASFGTGRQQQQDMLDKLADAGGDVDKVTKILEDAKAKSISDVPDVESSLDMLAYIYGEIRRLGLDVHKFVHDYTRRPIATMEDIFGSYDLQYEITDNDKALRLVKGTPGFHSTAIDKTASTYGQLLGLLDNPDLELPRLKTGGKKEPLSRDLDPRPGRREQVEKYLLEINAASGGLGVGVQG